MDSVNHPDHYTDFSNGSEVIDITENLSFNLGNVVKYVARAGRKTEDPLEDLLKAEFYLRREIARLVPEPPTFAEEAASNMWSDEPPKFNIHDEVQKLWDKRRLDWSIVINGPRQWWLLDQVPPNTIVQDVDGDQYRRINGTGQFQIRWDSTVDWEEPSDYIYLNQQAFAPFTEVK